MATPGATAAQSDATRPTWLVMVYMQAGDTSQLDNLAIQDLVEMEAGVGENPHVQVLIQIQRRWPAVPQLYLLKSGALPEVRCRAAARDDHANDRDLLNMGTSKVLERFLAAGLAQGQEAGVEKYCLVLWGHAFGLGFGRDHGDALHLHELRTALGQFSKALGRRLDLLATNSCTMSYIEAAYELKEDVRYLAGSQVFVPLTGLPYKQILAGIDSQTEPDQLGTAIVDRYVEHFANSPQGERVAMTLLDLDGANSFNDLLNGVADTITSIVGDASSIDFERRSEIQDVFMVNPAGDVRPVLDLGVLALDLRQLADDLTASREASHGARPAEAPTENARRAARSLQELRHQADRLAAAVDNTAVNGQAVGARPQDAGALDGARLVVHHNQHPDLAELRGIGVFAPFVVDKAFRQQLEIDVPEARGPDYFKRMGGYESLKIFTEGGKPGGWPKLVYDTLRRDEPDEIVDATGVVLPAERQQVNQLLGAVEAAFNRLDRLLTNAEPQLVAAVSQKRREDLDSKAILATFGLPRLKLAGDLSLEDPERFKGMGLKEPGTSDAGASIVPTLEKLEQAVQLVEKTIKRVVTNGTFGLGPPNTATRRLMHLGPKPAGDVLGPKPAGDVLGPKPAGDVLGPKPAGDVLGPKPAGDVLGAETGALLAFLTTDTQASGLAVSTLFAHVATVLVRLEQAAAAIERTAAQFLFDPTYGAMLSDDDYGKTVAIRFERTFGVMKDVSLEARRSVRRVLAHPVYGLGPGPEGLEQAERDDLAAAAGLNRRNLLLL